MPPKNPTWSNVKIAYRGRVRDKIGEIKAYIDEHNGNDPENTTGWKVVLKVFDEIERIRRWPWASPHVENLEENYRKQRAGNYMIYYYVVDPKSLIYIIELRHTSQKPLQPSTLKKYKREVDKQEAQE